VLVLSLREGKENESQVDNQLRLRSHKYEYKSRFWLMAHSSFIHTMIRVKCLRSLVQKHNSMPVSHIE